MNKYKINFITDDFIKKLITDTAGEKEKCVILEWQKVQDREAVGFCSKIIRISVTYQSTGKRQECHFVAKIPYESLLYETLNLTGIYEKEIFMYRTIIPRLHSLFGEDILAAKLYATDNHHAIILEDLSNQGYSICPKGETLDFEHNMMLIKHLAKLHATSLKLNQQCSEIFTVIKTDSLTLSSLRDKEVNKMFTDRLLSVLRIVIPDVFEKRKHHIQRYAEHFIDLVIEEMTQIPDQFNVLTHGDVWTNNVMFKYDKFQEIERVKFIDFQLSYWTNPVVDIFYFVVTCCPFSLYKKHMDLLLETYIKSLHNTWRYLKYDDRSYSLDDLKQDMEKRHNYGLFVAMYILALTLGDASIDATKVNNLKSVESEKFKIAAKGWLEYFVQKVLPSVTM